MSEKVAKAIVYILTTEDVIVSIAYLIAGKYSHAIYWAAAAIICATTLYLR